MILAHIYGTNPAPGTGVITFYIQHPHGAYGTRLIDNLPASLTTTATSSASPRPCTAPTPTAARPTATSRRLRRPAGLPRRQLRLRPRLDDASKAASPSPRPWSAAAGWENDTSVSPRSSGAIPPKTLAQRYGRELGVAACPDAKRRTCGIYSRTSVQPDAITALFLASSCIAKRCNCGRAERPGASSQGLPAQCDSGPAECPTATAQGPKAML